MAYTAEISRANPTCVLILLDQSGSMADKWGGAGEVARTKAQSAADTVNRWLMELVLRCTKAEGVRDYFHVGVIGYGGRVGPAFGGALRDLELIPVSQLADNPLRVEERTRKMEDGAGGLVDQTTRFPIWFEPTTVNGTPMCQALSQAERIVTEWVTEHPASFPPVIINISDGEPTDGNPTAVSEAIRRLGTEDGSCLLFNIHISATPGQAIEFPVDEAGLPDEHARLLFGMSSELTDQMRMYAGQAYSSQPSVGARGFAFQADAVLLIKFLDIGSRMPDLR